MEQKAPGRYIMDVHPSLLPPSLLITCQRFYGELRTDCQKAVTATCAVVLATLTDWQEACSSLVGAARQPPPPSLPGAQAACLAVLACHSPGTAEAAESRNPSAAGRTTLRAYLHHLYGYATGWLGRTSSETWTVKRLQKAQPLHLFPIRQISRSTLRRQPEGLTGVMEGPEKNLQRAKCRAEWCTWRCCRTRPSEDSRGGCCRLSVLA